MGSEDLASLAAFANELADAARAEILPYWRRPVEVEEKVEDGRPVVESPVTIADRAAERAMRALIAARYPQHGVRGEEDGDTNPGAEWCWVLDPIDGTKSFITGKPLFGTLVGLCRNVRARAGPPARTPAPCIAAPRRAHRPAPAPRGRAGLARRRRDRPLRAA